MFHVGFQMTELGTHHDGVECFWCVSAEYEDVFPGLVIAFAAHSRWHGILFHIDHGVMQSESQAHEVQGLSHGSACFGTFHRGIGHVPGDHTAGSGHTPEFLCYFFKGETVAFVITDVIVGRTSQCELD